MAVTPGCREADRQAAPQTPAVPKNVILLIGDGMGAEHIKAGSFYASGTPDSLFMQSMPYKAQVVTTPAKSPDMPAGKVPITDSAAAATAMATGHKAYDSVLSVALPGDGRPLKTVLESFADQGKMTGLVTTAYITDATPAAFASHTEGRKNHADVVTGYLNTVRPNLIMGGGDSDKAANLTGQTIKAAGYQLITDRKGLAALEPAPQGHVFGLFGPTNMPYESDKATAATQPAQAALLEMPSLSEMTQAALKTAAAHPKGFFLMIEGGLIDKAAHANDTPRMVQEVVEFDKTVKLVMDWAANRSDTLVLVVADHETGGLKVVQGNGQGRVPTVVWASQDHTGINVILYAWGVGADKVTGVLDNTDIYRLMMGTFTASSVPATPPALKTDPAMSAPGVQTKRTSD